MACGKELSKRSFAVLSKVLGNYTVSFRPSVFEEVTVFAASFFESTLRLYCFDQQICFSFTFRRYVWCFSFDFAVRCDYAAVTEEMGRFLSGSFTDCVA